MSEKLISADYLFAKIDKWVLDCDGISFEELKKTLNNAPAVDAVAVDKVAQMLYEFTGDDCPCNYNDNDEWLPEVCELREECPYPADRLGCWKQFVKRYGERREDNEID